MRYKKGSALIVTIMITTILLIMLGGLFSVAMNIISPANNEVSEKRVFWACEGASNHAMKVLRRMKNQFYLNAGTKAAAMNADPAYNKVTINGIDVDITYTFVSNTDGWKYEAKAQIPNGGRTCVIGRSMIRGTSMAKHTITMGEDMDKSTYFWGGLSTIGPVYTKGYLNISGYPRFYGNVYSSSSKTSREHNSSKWTLQDNPGYERGLDVTGGNWRSGDAALLEEAADDVFRKAYHQDQPDVDQNENVIHSWTDLKNGNTSDTNIKEYIIGDNSGDPFAGSQPTNSEHRSIRFSFLGDKVRITSRNKNGNLLKNGTTIVMDKTIALSDYNTFLVPEYDTRNVHVEVEGEIGKDVTVATEANNVLITNDIYYSGLDEEIALQLSSDETIRITPSKWQLNSGADQEERDRLTLQALTDFVHDPANGITEKFGLMAGIGKTDGVYNTAHIMTSYKLATGDLAPGTGFINRKDGNRSRSFLNDAALLMGAYYAPGGMFGAQYQQNNALIRDEYYKDRNYSNNNTFWGGWRDMQKYRMNNYNNKAAYVALIGSVGMLKRGNLVGGDIDGKSVGIFTFFANDERFSTDGWSPLGFKPAVGKVNGEGVNLLTEGVKWTYGWE